MIFFLFAQLTPFIKWYYNFQLLSNIVFIWRGSKMQKKKWKNEKSNRGSVHKWIVGIFLKPCNNFITWCGNVLTLHTSKTWFSEFALMLFVLLLLGIVELVVSVSLLKQWKAYLHCWLFCLYLKNQPIILCCMMEFLTCW